jgi:hypothetical protein
MNVNAHGNNRVRQPRTGPRRSAAGLLTALLAGTALLAAACGGGSAGSTGSSPYAKALAYSQCMRSNGVASYPDPNGQGQILMTANDWKEIDVGSPQFAQAAKACRKLAPKNTISTQQYRQLLSQGLKYSACMRAHGITDYPDPSTAGGGLVVDAIPKADADLPQFPAAEQACRSLSPGGGS